MKTLIVYASKYGATKKIAESIADIIGAADLADVKCCDEISLNDYDGIILGSRLTAGKTQKEFNRFLNENADRLGNMKIGLFLSGLQESGEDEYFKQNFSSELLDKAISKAFLGGVFDPKKCSFFERKLIKVIAKLDSYTCVINEEKIETFAQKFL